VNSINSSTTKLLLISIFLFVPAIGQCISTEFSNESRIGTSIGASELLYRQIRVKNIDINYTELGTGQAIIFIHGWSSNSGYWLEQIKHFSKTHRAIAYDWRGMGKSTGAEQAYKFDQLVDDLKEFIDALGLRKPIIVGHSQGAVTALHFAAKYPNDTGAIISADAPGASNFVTGRFMYWILRASTAITGILEDDTALSLQIPLNAYFFYSTRFRQACPQTLERWKKQFVSNSPLSLVYAMQALAYRTHLSIVTSGVPVLLVLGSEDRFINIEQTQAYRQFFSDSEIEILPGAGHMSTEEQPDRFNSITKRFISKHFNANTH